MSLTHTKARRAACGPLAKALGCLALLLLCHGVARADTFDLFGTSHTQSPLGGPNGVSLVSFFQRPFTQTLTVNAAGQTFDINFGTFLIHPSNAFVVAGCTDGPCLTLTGTLDLPASVPLSFGGVFDLSTGGGTHLTIDWRTGSGPINFTTSQGGTGQFVIELLDFQATNADFFSQFYSQFARVTITQFTPAPVPEPATLLLLGTGLAGAACAARKRRTAAR